MKNGQHEKKSAFQGKTLKKWLPLILVIAILAAIGSGTYAFLHKETNGGAKNTFKKAEVDCQLNEDFDGAEKKNVNVSNNGTALIKVRVAVIVNWMDVSGNISAKAPVEGTDYSASYGEDWTLGGDGFWYYKEAIKPHEVSSNLINSLKPIVEKVGYQLTADISVEAIQADAEWN